MLLKIIPSYAYRQYQDDENITALAEAQNDMAQGMLDWFTSINLPVYTSPTINGPLLDWVAEGLYGMTRPVLPAGATHNTGPFNTLGFNAIEYNELRIIGPQSFYATTDDVFKRVMTWNYYKGDGVDFDIRWLKRRVMRFLLGDDGTAPNIDNTYPVSVTFGSGNEVSITIVGGTRTITGGALFNRMGFNSVPFGRMTTSFAPLPNFNLAPILKSAILSGAVQLPFQFSYDVNIS